MRPSLKHKVTKFSLAVPTLLTHYSIENRESKVTIEDIEKIDYDVFKVCEARRQIKSILKKDFNTKKGKKFPYVFVFFGAHVIKNGAQKWLIDLMKKERIHFLATNGASVVHDLELAAFGRTSEYVEKNLPEGKFGMWEETQELFRRLCLYGVENNLGREVGDFLYNERKNLFPHCSYSLFYQSYKYNVPTFVFPSVGQDIYCLGSDWYAGCRGFYQAAYEDFLNLVAAFVLYGEDAIILSLGSAVMAPQVFEKALSAAINIKKKFIKFRRIYVVDLKPNMTDWEGGTPTEDVSSYYARDQKSFRRSKSPVKYVQADHKAFLECVERVCEKANK